MKCIFCEIKDTDVIETRPSDESSVVRRRRECSGCQRRFTTYERVEQVPIVVIKRDGKRERFDREKLLRGILKSTEKTTIPFDEIERIVNRIEQDLGKSESEEVESNEIGNKVADSLKKLDKVAYIRFASVFRRFVDIEDFEQELKKITKKS